MRLGRGFTLGVLCAACGGGGGSGNGPTPPPPPPPPPTPTVTGVQVPSVTIDSGQVTTLTATITYTGATAPSVTASWTSADPSVATVASTGPLTASVTGRKGGAVAVSASAAGQTGTGTVTVRPDRRILTTRNLLFAKNWEPFAGGTPNNEILLLPAGRDTIINLTFHPSSDDAMMWSLDGSRVFFETTRDDPSNSGSLANYALYSMPVTGGAPQRVVGLGVLGWKVYGINRTSGRLHLLRVNTLLEQEGFYTLNLDGTGLTRLGSASGLLPPNPSPLPRFMALSNSTTQVAYITNKQLFVAAFSASSNPRAIAIPCTFSCDGPVWSKDDQRIAYHADGGLWVYNLTTNQNTKLADSDTQCPPDWSPNDSEIAYAHGGRLYAINTTTAARVNLDELVSCTIHWSPDGQLIAYQGGQFRANLMLVRRSDGITRQVLPSQGLGFTFRMRWAPQ